MGRIFSFCRIPDGSIAGKDIRGFNWISIYESKAKYDLLTKIITYTFVIMPTATDIWITYLAIKSNIFSIAIFINILIIPIFVILYLFSPQKYIITTNGILIKRPLRSFLIPYINIESVNKISWTWKHIRLFASGGLYGFYGLFRVYKLGNVWMYVTNRKNIILIKLKGGNKYMISPDDPLTFINKVTNMIKLQTK